MELEKLTNLREAVSAAAIWHSESFVTHTSFDSKTGLAAALSVSCPSPVRDPHAGVTLSMGRVRDERQSDSFTLKNKDQLVFLRDALTDLIDARVL